MGLAALLAGCASTGGTEASDAVEVEVRVENDLRSATATWLWILDEDGDATRLGRLRADTTVTFRYLPRGQLGQHRLVADDVGGRTMRSRPFRVAGDLVVTWTLSTGRLEVREVASP